MTMLLEPDAIAEHAAPATSDARPSTWTAPRLCTVLEGVTMHGGVALLYVFQSARATMPDLRGQAQRPLRIPGKRWRHAWDLRAGDHVKLASGEVVVIDRLVAAPSLRDIGVFEPIRIRNWRLAADGGWTPCDRGAG